MTEATAPLAPHHLDQLRRACGEVITADDAPYDDARRLWNAIHDRRPAVIVRPTTATKVATAVRFARDHDLEIQVQSGGHSAAKVANPSGGFNARVPTRISSIAHLKLQKLSGKRGLISSRRMAGSLVGRQAFDRQQRR